AAIACAPDAGCAQYLVRRQRSGAQNALIGIRGSMSENLSDDLVKTARITAPRRAMVLAAGLGTRMRAHNGQIPKPLVMVGGKPLIDYVLDRLAEAGVEHAVVNVHHLADQIERHLATRQCPGIIISDERQELLNTGGAVIKALPHLGDRPFFHV